MNPKVSVIVPIYGVEKYIERCARSLFEQSLDNIEFVFVNDCTQDNSMNILFDIIKQYPNRKDQIIVVNNEQNLGLPQTRKKGIEHSHGDYVIHCDSDDWVDCNMYEDLYAFAVKKQLDMVWCDYYRSNGTNHRYVTQKCHSNRFDLLSKLLVGGTSGILGSVCNRLCKRTLLKDIIYPQANMTEDLVMTIQFVLNCDKVGYLPKAYYYYYENSESICLKPDKDAILRNLKGIKTNNELILQILRTNNLEDKLSDQIVTKKVFCKEVLIPLLNEKEYRKLWIDTYPEVNTRIMRNSFIPLKTKIRAFCLLYGGYPIYSLLKSLMIHLK